MNTTKKDRGPIRERVLAACRELAAEGRRLSIKQIRLATGYGDDLCAEVRNALGGEGLLDGLWPEDVNANLLAIPDDPDAAEIESRIEAIRARKRQHAEPVVETMRTRCIFPVQRVRSRQPLTL